MITLNETNWKRILNNFSSCGFAVLTSDRKFNADGSHRTVADKRTNRGALLDALRSKGYEPIVVHGGYQEVGTNPELEKSFLVPFMDVNTKEPLPADVCRNDMISLGGDFEQETILLQMPGDKPKYVAAKDFTDDDGNEYKAGDTTMEFDGASFPDEVGDVYFSDIKRQRGPRRAKDIDYEEILKKSSDPEEISRAKNKLNQLKNEENATLERLVYESMENTNDKQKLEEATFIASSTGNMSFQNVERPAGDKSNVEAFVNSLLYKENTEEENKAAPARKLSESMEPTEEEFQDIYESSIEDASEEEVKQAFLDEKGFETISTDEVTICDAEDDYGFDSKVGRVTLNKQFVDSWIEMCYDLKQALDAHQADFYFDWDEMIAEAQVNGDVTFGEFEYKGKRYFGYGFFH